MAIRVHSFPRKLLQRWIHLRSTTKCFVAVCMVAAIGLAGWSCNVDKREAEHVKKLMAKRLAEGRFPTTAQSMSVWLPRAARCNGVLFTLLALCFPLVERKLTNER